MKDGKEFWTRMRAHVARLMQAAACDEQDGADQLALCDERIAAHSRAPASPRLTTATAIPRLPHRQHEKRAAYMRQFLARTGMILPKAEGNARGIGEPDIAPAADGATEVRLYGPIEAHVVAEMMPPGAVVTDVGFARALDRVQGKRLRLRINSIGGDVFAGIAIATMVRQHGIPVVIDGVAASIASVIAASSPIVSMEMGATVMVHSPWSCACGNAQGLRAEAAVLDKLRESMLDIYSGKTRTKYTRTQWAAALDGRDGVDGTWWTAAEAVAIGIADSNQPTPSNADTHTARAAALVEDRKRAATLNGVRLPKRLLHPLPLATGAFTYAAGA